MCPSRNPFLSLSLRVLPWLFLLLSVSAAASETPPASAAVTDVADWQLLTKTNFSSQIRTHSHILLFVTLPWFGEARSLMREINHLVLLKREEFGHLKLFLVYRNSEKILADILGATEGTKIIYYQNSVQLNYNGRHRALNILSSISHTMLIHNDEIPLKPVKESDEIESFLDSTEKSVFLIDLCGWSAKYVPKKANASYDSSLSSESDRVASGSLVKEVYKTIELSSTKDKKNIIENEEIAHIGDTARSAWELQFTLANQSVPDETGNGEIYNEQACTLEEFQKFQAFYKDLIPLVKEHYLPPERQRFGLVSSKYLLPALGIENVEDWSVLVRFSGCPNCSLMLRDGDELRSVLDNHHPLVKELDTEALFPSNRPSLVLFIDRSAESSDIRSESRLALEVIRKYAGENCKSVIPWRVSASRRTSQRDAPDSKVTKIKDNMVMVYNEGLNEGNDNSLIDILTKLLQQTRANQQKSKEKKVSVVAKELGFQLLSRDFDVKEVQPTLAVADQSDSQSVDVTSDPLEDQDATNFEQKAVPKIDNEEEAMHVKLGDGELETEAEELIISEMKQQSVSISSVQSHQVKKEQSDDLSGFVGSIFFLDGSYELLHSLTSGSKLPTLVIIDPTRQQHFVLDKESRISDSSVVNFIGRFLNQSLPPFMRSDPLVSGMKEFPRPPFVNQDFHEAVSVPRISANGFCEAVLGYKDCLIHDKAIDPANVTAAWSTDVLVLFSNSWCGFCQRMQLLLREVFRAFDTFMTLTKENEGRRGTSLTDLPLIYLMDCTLNDCSPFLRATGKEELYPTLLLFPAKTKKPVAFDSTMSVINIFEFLDANSRNFKNYRDILWRHAREMIEEKSESQDQDISLAMEAQKVSELGLLEKEAPSMKSESEDKRYLIKTGLTLSATEQLANSSPFDNATVLIVSADPDEGGLKGLIINKHLKWDVFKPDALVDSVKAAPLSYGGPVAVRGFPLVSLSNKTTTTDGYVEVINGVYFGDTVATNHVLKSIQSGNESVDAYWFFLGFSSWLYEQLFDELDQGAWHLSQSTVERLHWPYS